MKEKNSDNKKLKKDKISYNRNETNHELETNVDKSKENKKLTKSKEKKKEKKNNEKKNNEKKNKENKGKKEQNYNEETKKKKEYSEPISEKKKNNINNTSSTKNILMLMIPLLLFCLACIIFFTIYFTKRSKDKTNEEFDKFSGEEINKKIYTLTPEKGYDTIYIHLGGIGEILGYFNYFFKGPLTFIPKGTKIYYLIGDNTTIEYSKPDSVPNWFNVDKQGNLICSNCGEDNFKEAKNSLEYILNKIDEISVEENIAYDKIYLGGFSQGAIMTNYVLLNSKHKLGGYLAFSGYIFDHHFPANKLVTELTSEQKNILDSKQDYHILATHSFNDDSVSYDKIIEAYYTYFKNYIDFTLLSFSQKNNIFDRQPTHPLVRKWLKDSMGK